MFIVMNLYQNGDIEILQKDSEWDSDGEVLFSENFFRISKKSDQYLETPLFDHYQEVIRKYEKLLSIGKNSWDGHLKEGAKRGELIESVVLLNLEYREIHKTVFSNEISKKTLEDNLSKLSKNLENSAKTFKKETQKKFKEEFDEVTF
jgi:hypothetical protein